MPRKVDLLSSESHLIDVGTNPFRKIPRSEWAATLTGELLLCALFARLLLNVPEKEWLQTLIDQGVFAELPFATNQPLAIQGQQLLAEWAIRNKTGLETDSLTDLKVDYTYLFSGGLGTPVAPWESVYFSDEQLLFQEQTLDVRAWYNRFGLKAVNQYREPDDHIGLELSLIAHLAKLALGEIERGDESRAEQLLQAQRDFLSQHLIRWGPLWCSLVIKHARTDFYRGLALLLKGALTEMATLFALTMTDSDR